MSIEEAILQEKELAKCKREEAFSWTKEGWEKAFKNLTLGQEQEIRLRREEMAKMSIEIAIGHEQIANWLQELKERREKESRQTPSDIIDWDNIGEVILYYKMGYTIADEAMNQIIEIYDGKEESK